MNRLVPPSIWSNQTVMVSGGFDPIHAGHVAMIRDAAKHGDVIVVANSDEWLMRKKGFVFMPFEERRDILKEIKGVIIVAAVDDSDGTVCDALHKIRPDYFANGGDRGKENTPEQDVCEELEIRMLWGVGGDYKRNSSSDLAKNLVENYPKGEQMRFLLLTTLLACGGDISIIARQDEKTNDTQEQVVVVEDTEVSSPSTEPSSPTSEPESQMTELSVGLATIHFRQISCPACMGAYGEFEISAELKMHQPTSGDYFDYMTPVGTCTTQLLESYVSSQPLQATQPAMFNSISLNPSGQGEWSNTYLYEHQIERQTPHSITTENGTIINAFTSIEGFDDIQPYTLLWVDPSYAFDAVISKNGTSFSWYPVLSGDEFEILIAVYSPDGSQLLGAVSCQDQDTGSMFVPGNYFTQFPYWSLAAVHLIRHRVDRQPAPDFNGYLDSHMIWEVVGTGHIE